MTTRFSCADFTFPLLPHAKVLELIRLLGIEGVDLGIFEDRSHHYPSQISKDPQGQGRRLREQLCSLELVPADVFIQTGADPSVAAANAPDASIRERNRDTFRRLLDFTSVLECSHVTGLPGVNHPGSRLEDDWARARDEANWRVSEAGQRGITYAIEPHVGSILGDPESTARFLSETSGLTLTLDYGHFIYQGIDNASVHPLLAHASHFHARGGAPGQLQATVKDSQIDFAAIVKRLRKLGYPGWICLEYVWVDWEGCNRTDNISETLLLKELLEQASASAP